MNDGIILMVIGIVMITVGAVGIINYFLVEQPKLDVCNTLFPDIYFNFTQWNQHKHCMAYPEEYKP
jgi:hypothetical protein